MRAARAEASAAEGRAAAEGAWGSEVVTGLLQRGGEAIGDIGRAMPLPAMASLLPQAAFPLPTPKLIHSPSHVQLLL